MVNFMRRGNLLCAACYRAHVGCHSGRHVSDDELVGALVRDEKLPPIDVDVVRLRQPRNDDGFGVWPDTDDLVEDVIGDEQLLRPPRDACWLLDLGRSTPDVDVSRPGAEQYPTELLEEAVVGLRSSPAYRRPASWPGAFAFPLTCSWLCSIALYRPRRRLVVGR